MVPMRELRLHLARQPDFGESPVFLDGGQRKGKRVGDFDKCQSAKYSMFGDLRMPGIQRFHGFQQVIDYQQLDMVISIIDGSGR